MLFPTHTKGSLVSTAKHLGTTAAVTVSLVLFTSCGSGDAADVDVSEDGQIAYACALADHVEDEHGDPASWAEYIGEDADPGVRETSSIGALLMATEDAGLNEVGEKLVEGVSRVDIEALTAGLAEARESCQDVDGTQHADVSHEGQLDYACTLAASIPDKHGDTASWVNEEELPTVWYEVAGATALTGALNGQILPEHQELSEAGADLTAVLNTSDADRIDDAFAAFQSACDDR